MKFEGQREGVTKAKAAGKYKVRKPLKTEHRQEFLSLAENSKTKTFNAKHLNIGDATV